MHFGCTFGCLLGTYTAFTPQIDPHTMPGSTKTTAPYPWGACCAPCVLCVRTMPAVHTIL